MPIKKKSILNRAGVALIAALLATAGWWGSALADANCATTLSGYPVGRFVVDNGGCAHQNGSDSYDGADKTTTLARATYDFAVHGGATSTFNLGVSNGAASTITLPANAVILDGVVDVVTAMSPNSTGAGVQITSEAAGDIVNSDATYFQSGRKAISPISAATSVKTSTSRALKMTVSGTPLTAGKVVVFLRYFISG